jgi:peroxiredoxin
MGLGSNCSAALVSAALVAVLTGSCALGCSVTPQARPRLYDDTAIQETRYQELLSLYVDAHGQVDYDHWKSHPEHVKGLEAHVRRLLATPPHAEPELYPDAASQLAYWLNLYNALVIREVLARWPLASVRDVPSLGPGFGHGGRGFFYDLSFEVGGRRMSLLDIETTIIRTHFQDARTHFAMSCGTRSCALLPRQAFDPHELDTQLENAARTFVNDRRNVSVDHEKRVLSLSPVLAWYEQDFIEYVKNITSHPAPDLVDFLRIYANSRLSQELVRARKGDDRIELVPYDWRVNAPLPGPVDTPSQDNAADRPAIGRGIGAPLPEVELELVDGQRWRPSDSRGQVVLLDFWATWCRPCLVSFPRYTALQLAHERRGLRVIAVAEDDGPEPVRAFVKANGIAFDVAVDGEHRAAQAPLSVATLPTVLLIDRAGVVRQRYEGYDERDVDALAADLEALLQEPDPTEDPPARDHGLDASRYTTGQMR